MSLFLLFFYFNVAKDLKVLNFNLNSYIDTHAYIQIKPEQFKRF